ncbi:glycosyltransferase family 4 protein [Danxiaibacter flavus]|uniref:Glycosyltransferase family 4 protein n=1 Tax=Danxiaibacter flavus TaxID=3049108 RepID=A0ABV3Z948_9BACT|nr:glycosyltransferase family 4 protein [Chitinophagaceae bacterium DXS]
MLTLLDITFFSNHEFKTGSELIRSQASALGYLDFIGQQMHVEVIKHIRSEEHLEVNNIPFHFFKTTNRFFSVPFKTLQYVRKIKPDVVLVQGLIFPFQVMLLKAVLGKRTIILAQHHGEQANKSILRNFFNKLADKCITAYLFNTPAYAEKRLLQKTIAHSRKIKQLPEGSNSFTQKNKQQARVELNIDAKGPVFLWVGRLNENKDPLTILKAFELYSFLVPGARLYMIYQTDNLLRQIRTVLGQDSQLQERVHLVGKVDHEELESWYNAADFFLSGSHSEYGGFAVLEAMACGCIPVTTNIPTMQQYLQHGKLGFLFAPGDVAALANVLLDLENYDIEKMSKDIAAHFRHTYSFEKIADGLKEICFGLYFEQVQHFPHGVVNAVSANG